MPFIYVWPKGYLEPHNEIGVLSLAKCLVGLELYILQFHSQCLNPLGHSIPTSLAEAATVISNDAKTWTACFINGITCLLIEAS